MPDVPSAAALDRAYTGQGGESGFVAEAAGIPTKTPGLRCGNDTDTAHGGQVRDVLVDELGDFLVGLAGFVGQIADAAGQAQHHGAAGAVSGIGGGRGA
jgi:hypothetical protein